MAQTYTSAKTSMNAKKLPKVFGLLPPLRRNSILIDYGAGKFTDHIREAMPHVVYCPYDPFNQPDDVNRTTLYYLFSAARIRMPVTITCSNVLNVIDDDDTVRGIADTLSRFVAATGGTAYITVYAGDGSGIGRQTGPDQYQRNEPLTSYMQYFEDPRPVTYYNKAYRSTATIERGMIVIRSEEVKA